VQAAAQPALPQARSQQLRESAVQPAHSKALEAQALAVAQPVLPPARELEEQAGQMAQVKASGPRVPAAVQTVWPRAGPEEPQPVAARWLSRQARAVLLEPRALAVAQLVLPLALKAEQAVAAWQVKTRA
jgi:hypothetical protein